MAVPNEIKRLCKAFLRGLNTTLGKKLYGVYLYGATAFPEGGPIGDIDFHVILNETLNDREKSELNILHVTLARDFPPLGAELDGYYILLEEARRDLPPKHQILPGVTDKSWALHREHIRAGRCIVLQGPDPKEIYPATTWQELETALQGELDFVEQHLADASAYCVLNLCRLMYSFKTKDVVVSKFAAAQWGEDNFPEWKPLIETARKLYERQATTQDKEFLASKVRNFFDFACKHIRESWNKLSTS
jgi:hypothetical protein